MKTKTKVIALLLVILSLGSMVYSNSILLNQLLTNTPAKPSLLTTNNNNNNNNNQQLANLHNPTPQVFSKLNPSRVNWGNPNLNLTVNTNTSVSNYGVNNSANFPMFAFSLTKGYYLEINLTQANWFSSIDVTGNGNYTTNYLDIDFELFYGNSTASTQYSWFNATSKNENEFISTIIPQSGYYYMVLYYYEDEFLTYGSQVSSVLIDAKNNLYNTTYYGGSVGGTSPHANSIILQEVDAGYAVYGNNLDLHNALTYDVLPHLPELRPGLTTWLWESNKFGLPINDLYKVFVPKNTSISVDIIYNDTQVSTRVGTGMEVLELINYNDYIGYLNGTFSGSYKYIGTNTLVTASVQYLNSSYYYNLKSPEDTYYIIGINNSLLSIPGTFTYNISIRFKDYIDNTNPNNNPTSATDVSKIVANYILWTNKNDSDFFSITTTQAPLRLTVNLFFDRNYGQINLYLFNKTIKTSLDESLSLVGASTFLDQNQQTIVYTIFDNSTYYIKVNSTAQYSNNYQLNVTLSAIDDQYEPNDNILQSALLYKPGLYDLFLVKNNLDYFKVFLFNQDKMNVTITFIASLGNLNLKIFGPDLFTTLGISASTTSNTESVAITAEKNGYYYIEVYGVSATFAKPGIDYVLNLNLVPMDDYLEPNNDKNHAVPIQDGFFQLISRAGNEDWFNFYMRQGDYMTISVTFDTSKGDIDIFMYDKAVSKLYNSSQSFLNNESFSFTAPYEGEFLIRVALFDGLSVNYNMNITLTDWKYDQYEPNDNFAEAYSLNPGYYNGIIAQGGDHDFFKVSVPTGYAIIVELKNVTSNKGNLFKLALYNSQFALINSSERNLNSQYISPVAVKSATELYIEAYFKGFDKVTYSLNITIGLSSVIFPQQAINPATKIPSFGLNTNQTTTTGIPPLYDLGTLLTIGLVGLGGGAAAGAGGTIIAQKTNLATKIKLKFKPKK